MTDSVQTFLGFHSDKCAFRGHSFEDIGSGLDLCCCDPDGSWAQARIDTLRRYDQRMVLHQKKVWYNRAGEPIVVKQMSLRYKRNVLNFILRRTQYWYNTEYYQMSSFASDLGGDMAIDAAESMIDQLLYTKPADWIETMPLVKRLRKLIEAGHDGPVD